MSTASVVLDSVGKVSEIKPSKPVIFIFVLIKKSKILLFSKKLRKFFFAYFEKNMLGNSGVVKNSLVTYLSTMSCLLLPWT